MRALGDVEHGYQTGRGLHRTAPKAHGGNLEGAAAIAEAANACAEAGNPEKAIEIALDFEQLIYEAETLLNAVSLLNRITKA
jgi:hypothetical protein